jgi:hypothetical protein
MPANNHLEQLIAEWYEFQGYFVRRNVNVGPLPGGGFECELDIVAINPVLNKLVHVEPSLDADSWAERERRYIKKFAAGRKYIPTLFQGFTLPAEIDHVAVLVFARKRDHTTLSGGRLLLAADYLVEIFECIRTLKLDSNAIPEHLPILRSFQYVCQYWSTIKQVMEPSLAPSTKV